MTIAFGLRQMKRRKQKSHKLRPGVNSPGSFLPGIEPEQLFVFDSPERPELPGPVKLYRVYLFKIVVDTYVDVVYSGISKRRYAMQTVTKKELFMWQAPSFNFDLSADQILDKALKVGFVKKVGDDKYLVNEDY